MNESQTQTENSPFLLSIVIPEYNEVGTIPELFKRLRTVVETLKAEHSCKVEIIFVNDGSKDGTLALLQAEKNNAEHISIIDLSRNFGHQIAITAGMDYCKGDAVVVMDGDLQDPPEVIPQLVKSWREGVDIVHARRLVRKGESLFKRVTAKMYYRMIRELSNVEMPVDVGDFRLISRRALDAFKEMRESHRYVRGMVSWVGFKQAYVDYERDARFLGKTNYSLIKMINLSLDGLVSVSTVPLRIATFMGLVSVLIGFVYLIYALVAKFVLHSTVLGWTSIVLVLLLIGGTQLVCLGIIGEYVGVISEEIKRRPLYFVNKIL